jgi:uncharacterized protein YoxC
MDTTQMLLTIVLSVTTILLIIVGIQLFFVLQELRLTLKKARRIVDGFEKVGVSLEHGMGEMTGFVTGFKTLFKIIEMVQSKKHEK